MSGAVRHPVSGSVSPVQQRANVKDAVAGAVVAGVGGILCLDALSFATPSMPTGGLGPRFFPLIASGVLILGGLSLIATGLRGTAKPPDENEDAGPVPRWRLAAVVGIFVGFLVLFKPVGFLISTSVFLTAMTSFVRPDRLRTNAIVGVTTSVCIYFAFTQLLGVGLPVGVLG